MGIRDDVGAMLRAERQARRMDYGALARRITALEQKVEGVDLVDGHNLRRAELAERRLESSKAREAIALSAAQDHLETIDRLEKQLTELRRLNVNQRRTIIETANARDRYADQALIQSRRASDLVGEIRVLIDDFTDRMDRNQRELSMQPTGYVRGRRDVFAYAVRKLRGLIE